MSDTTPVEAYLAKQPEAQQAALERLRALILRVLPDAEEAISYGIVGFRSKGRMVVWIAGWKAHVSIYPLTDGFLAAHRDELAGYESGRGTLRFKPDAPPPDALLEELVRFRAAEAQA